MSAPAVPTPTIPRRWERNLYGMLLWIAFPRTFVDTNRRELWYAFVCERRRRSNSGALGTTLFWHDTVADLLASGVRVRWSALLEPATTLRSGVAVYPYQPMESLMSANERFKEGESVRFWAGVILGTALHVALFIGFPAMSAADEVRPDRVMTVVPGVHVPLPPPPPDIAQPAVPVADPSLSADVSATIPTLDGVWENVTLPPPPVGRDVTSELPEAWTGPVQTYPRLLNRDEVEEALTRYYPAMLREAGIQGTAAVTFLIDVDGRVATRRLSESSGMEAFDDAALEVADRMRFAPAMNRDTPIAVWVSFPVRFTLRR